VRSEKNELSTTETKKKRDKQIGNVYEPAMVGLVPSPK
jgi:hypothetical protein